MTTEINSLDHLREVLEKRREDRIREKEMQEKAELSEREEHRQYFVRMNTLLTWYSFKNPSRYQLRRIAESLLLRLATEHGVINYPVDYDLIHRMESGKKQMDKILSEKVEPVKAEEPVIIQKKRGKKVVEQD